MLDFCDDDSIFLIIIFPTRDWVIPPPQGTDLYYPTLPRHDVLQESIPSVMEESSESWTGSQEEETEETEFQKTPPQKRRASIHGEHV